MPLAVIARLIGQDHAGFQHGLRDARQALRAFMDRQEHAHAMPGAMVEIAPRGPKRRAGEGIQMLPRQPLGKAQPVDGDHAAQHLREGGFDLL